MAGVLQPTGSAAAPMLDGNWTLRAAAAMAGIYGNDAQEALYPILLVSDSDGKRPDCSTNRYTLTFPKGDLPPVNAFWSVTMYNDKQFLVANPLNRYLINTPMLPNMTRDADGSLTLYIQKDSPAPARNRTGCRRPPGRSSS